jgi:hypothetical protein
MRTNLLVLLGVVFLLAGCAPSASPQPSAAAVTPSAAPASPTTATTPSPAAAASPSTAASPTPEATLDREARWRDAIATVLPGLERFHPDPFHGTDRAAIEAVLAELDADLPSLDDDQVLVGLMRAFALVSAGGRDAHTGLYPWGSDGYPLTSLPIRLWLFDDGPHVTAALPPYEHLVGQRVTAVAGRPIDEVLAALDPFVPRDNASTVRLLLPRLFVTPEILRGAGIAPAGPVEFTLVDDGGPGTVESVTPIPMADYNAWAGPYGLFLPDDPRVLSRSRTDEPLWFEDVAPGVVYVAYNEVAFVPEEAQALAERLGRDDVDAIVVDVRHNTGGEVDALEAVLRAIEPAAARRGVRTWILTGRNTFSAASLFVARLADILGVRIAGEPMGGAPTAWGNSRPVELGSSGLVANVATAFEVGVDEDDERFTIEPDLPVDITPRDVARGRDPVLDAVLEALR